MITEKDLAMSNDLKQTLDEVKEKAGENSEAFITVKTPILIAWIVSTSKALPRRSWNRPKICSL